MSEELPQENEGAEGVEGADAAEAAPAKPARKKKLIIGAVAALLLAGGGGAGYMLLGGESAEGEAEAAASTGEPPAYVEVPAMTVNLRSPDGQARYLKLRFVLVAAKPEAQEELTARLPLILDAFQPFLRELRPEDLAGSAAVFRLKEELIVRAAGVVGPDMISDVLIQDLVQQ